MRPWSPAEDAALRILSPEVAAQKLRRKLASVMKRRAELGIAARKPHRNYRRWTPAEDALALSLPPREVAARLGCSLACVRTHVLRLKRKNERGPSA